MPEGTPATRGHSGTRPAQGTPEDPADELSPYYQQEAGAIIPLEHLAWDLECSRGQSRSLDMEYVKELEESLLGNPVIDYLGVYVWNAGTFGMLWKCHYAGLCALTTPYLNFNTTS